MSDQDVIERTAQARADKICQRYCSPGVHIAACREIVESIRAAVAEDREARSALIAQLTEALQDAVDELQEWSVAEHGEDFNSPKFNAALAAAKAEQER